MQTKQEIVTSTHIRPFVKCLQKEACQILAFAPKQCQKNEKKKKRGNHTWETRNKQDYKCERSFQNVS